MDERKIAIPLILACVIAAFAIPYGMGMFDAGTGADGEPTTTDDSQDADALEGAEASAREDGAASGDGSPTGQTVIDDLVAATDPTSPEGETIRSRLAPLEAAANDSVEPFPTPEPTTLYQATLSHPAHSQADLHYVESLHPLPKELDEALARVVLAHGVSTHMLSQSNPAPGASLQASLTMATALDTAMPTLERYIDHPVWDDPTEATAEDSSRAELEVPSLDEALIDLYASLGYGDETLDGLETPAATAAAELAPEESRALARLVTAQANVQRATASSLLFIAAPASHSDGQVEDATREVDDQFEGTPLEELTVATEQLRAAAQTAHETIHDAPVDEPVRDEPWTDPLGLIVVGTRGSDTYDSRHGGEQTVLDSAVDEVDGARSTVGDAGVNTSELATISDVDDARDQTATGEAGVEADNQSTDPKPGWHMLVLDPGGNDTYRNNAGGIEAGSVIVKADVDARGATDGVHSLLIRGDRVCTPGIAICEPGEPTLGPLLEQAAVEGPRATQGPVPVGLPLTATVVDAGGDDEYEDTGPVIQGAANGLGVGLLYDGDGDDSYEASKIAQGASENYGIGLLLDGDGNDTYEADHQAQGWVDMPDPNATASATTFGFFPAQEGRASIMLARVAEGSLIDTGGFDDYRIDDDIAGQGIAQIPDAFLRRGFSLHTFTYPAEHATAQLIDVGGDEQLPIPEVTIQGQTVEMTPSRVNVSQEKPAHFWLTRQVPEPPAQSIDFRTSDTTRYKTAVHADPGAVPDPVGDDAIRAGKVQFDCRENGNVGGFSIIMGERNSDNLAEAMVCGAEFFADTQALLLFGEPDQVSDPPALTLTFGGDTEYNGSIASVDANPEDDGSDSSSPGIFVDNTAYTLPSVLTDLDGNDTYEGGNDTIASVDGSGVAMVVDREGSDEMRAGNRSVAYADVPLGFGSGAVAAVIDLDGDLAVSSDEESQAFASKFESQGRFQEGVTMIPPMALLDAGADVDDPDPAAAEEPGSDDLRTAAVPSGLDLRAGNASQGYSEGLGVAVVVGSPGADSYEVDGWGQGVHDDQQIVTRFCDLQNIDQIPDAGVGQVRALNPWIGGLGLVIDADGDDRYRVDSGVGMGDAFADERHCAENGEGTLGPYHVNLLGLGSLVDVRGIDSYEVTDVPPRPDAFPPRSCSGANRTDCQPHDDRAWMAISEENAAGMRVTGSHKLPSTIGLGVDNLRNAHHLGMAACRNLDLRDPGSQTAGDTVADAGTEDANTTFAGSAIELECDETLGHLWDAYLGEVIESTLPFDRRPNLEMALPRADASLGVASGQSAEAPDDIGDDRLPLPDGVTVPDAPEPLFLGDAARPQCEDRERSGEVSPRGQPDLACLSITRDVDMGQWLTNDPAADRLDPGDTIGCNCSVRLQIDAAQDADRINLRNLDDRGLYPDRGRATTLTTATQTWYDGFNRFRIPLTADEPIQEGRLRGDFVQPEAAADFPVNLSQLPTGLARVDVAAVVEDTAAEETGGALPEAVNRWQPILIHERSFEQAYVSHVDDETMVFLSAPGPVDAEKEATIRLSDAAEDLQDELSDEDWEQINDTAFARELPSGTVIDGPERSPVVPQEGAPACAAMIQHRENGDAGVCWTGDEFVVGLPLGEIEPATVTTIGADHSDLPVTPVTLGDSDAEPRIQFSSEDEYGITTIRENVTEQPDIDGLDVHGVPGTEVRPAGEELASDLLNERTEENWAKITIVPDQDDAIGMTALNPDPDRINLTTKHTLREPLFGQPEVHEFEQERATHDHADVHQVLGTAEDAHPHIELWTPPSHRSNDASLLVDERLVYEDTERHVLGCANLNYADADQVSRLIAQDSERADNLHNRTCATFAHDGQLTYLVPLGDLTGTQIVRLNAHALQADGEIVTREIAGHIDPVGAQGQVFVKPTAAKTAETNVRLQLFPQTAEIPMLTGQPSTRGADSDLVETGLEVKGHNMSWTEVDDPWSGLPTPRRPSVDGDINLTDFTDEEADSSTIELRGVLHDESNNTLRTNVREFIVDRAAPNVTEARIVSGSGQDRLVLTVDEAVADVECLEEGCPMSAEEPIPGAEPEPFLDRTRLEIGPRSIVIPVLNLERGPTYEVGIELTDTLGNAVETNLSLETFTPLTVDASPMENTLVNKTVTLSWTTETEDSQTLSTFSSAYLLLPDGPCPIMQGEPGVVPANDVQTHERGPLSVLGEAGETTCEVPDEGVDATLLIYALAPNVGALALDQVPVHVDTTSPTVEAQAPEGWVNDTATIEISSQDALDTELEVFVDGEPRTVDGSSATIEISEEGVHDVLARATDEAGNVGVNQTTARVDKTSPTVSAEVLGVRGGLALVNATATDEPSGIRDVQLLTRSTSGPVVPGVGGEDVLLSIPVEADEDELVLHTRDEAKNTRDLRMAIDDVPRIESGPLVSELDLTTPAPDTLRATFQTTNETTPVILLDAGDRHIERALDPGHDHELTVEELPPGTEAQITVTVPSGADLLPVLNATAPMPSDDQPPTKLTDVEAEPVEGGVRLTWSPAEDDVGVREVVVERDGSEVAGTSATTYTDEPRTFQEHTYKLAAVDRAGNRGPWTEVDAQPIASFAITDLATEPEALSPDETVTVEATVQTPAGLTPDVVTLSVGDQQLPMEPTDEGPYSATYEVTTRLPTLDVAAEETDMVVNATAGDRFETETFPAPVVATTGPTGGADPDEIPATGILMAIATVALAAVTRRRWLV